MTFTIDTDQKTISVKGQVKLCEVYAQLKKMFPDNYKEYILKQEVESYPVHPYVPSYPLNPLNVPYFNTCGDTSVFSVINTQPDYSSVYTERPQLFSLTSN